MFAAREPSDIERFFRGLAEYAFHTRLGVVDPPLVEYVSRLLVKFVRNDEIPLPPATVADEGRDLAHLLMAARQRAARQRAADETREEYRHIGDSTLFWSGLYPEAILRQPSVAAEDHLRAFREAGRQAYWLVSTLEPDDAAEERLLFERLSHDYDICVEGLAEVRRAWGDAA